jgi:hypothetical protein
MEVVKNRRGRPVGSKNLQPLKPKGIRKYTEEEKKKKNEQKKARRDLKKELVGTQILSNLSKDECVPENICDDTDTPTKIAYLVDNFDANPEALVLFDKAQLTFTKPEDDCSHESWLCCCQFVLLVERMTRDWCL